jgi:spore germination cell wall hydrolase CwlJ-like protein
LQPLLQTRADARALFSAALAGAAVGVALGACYLAGGLASAASRHASATRVADAAGGAYSDAALISAPGADPGALAVIRRRDPAGALLVEGQDRQLEVFAERLQRRASGASADTGARLLLRASLGGAYNPAAAPFRNANILQSSRELECLTQAVYYESRGEGPSGQAAVAQVVLNRVRHPAFPKSVCAVVFQRAGVRNGCQFSFACDGSLRRPRDPGAWKRAERVATRAMSGSVMAEVGNATHFHTTAVAPAWGPSLMRVAQVGLHVFYRFGGRAGAPGAFTRQPDVSPPVDPTMDLVVAGLSASQASGVALAAAVVSAPPLVSGGVGGPSTPAAEPASAPEPKASGVEAPKAQATAAVAAAPALNPATAS